MSKRSRVYNAVRVDWQSYYTIVDMESYYANRKRREVIETGTFAECRKKIKACIAIDNERAGDGRYDDIRAPRRTGYSIVVGDFYYTIYDADK